jgi:hypothetical protein
MVSASDQFNGVLNAPILFFFALLVVIGAIWWAFSWAYKAVLDKTKALFELSRSEIQIATQVATRVENELKETVKKQAEELASLLMQIDEASRRGPFPTKIVLDSLAKLSETTAFAQTQMVKLEEANNAISVAVSSCAPWNAPWLDRSGTPLVLRVTKPSEKPTAVGKCRSAFPIRRFRSWSSELSPSNATGARFRWSPRACAARRSLRLAVSR